jgi:ribosome-binding factor A
LHRVLEKRGKLKSFPVATCAVGNGAEVESRAQKHHKERRIEAFKEELITILGGELGDPRIGLLTVTEVVMNEGGKALRIYIAVEGSEEEASETMQGLVSAASFIRHVLAENLKLRQPPELSFHIDRSQKYGARIEELLTRIQKKKKRWELA